MGDRTVRRVYATVVLIGVAAGGGMFFAASRTWASVEVAPPGMTADVVKVTGSSAVPLVTAMAFVVMAGSLAVVASAGWFRRSIGVLVLVAGVTGALTAIMAEGAIDDAMRDAVASSTSMTDGSGARDALVGAAGETLWRWVAAGAAVVAALVGAMVFAQGHRWPRMGQRYEAPGATRTATPQRPAEERDGADLWKSLDEGEDPTV